MARKDAPNTSELLRMAERMRADAWQLAERWSEVAAHDMPANRPRAGEQLARFGEIPAFLAALAHFLERLAAGEIEVDGGALHDDSLRAAAAEHARLRAAAGYNQRDMLAEFVALRRVLWEHFAGVDTSERPTFEGERVVNLLLDTVIVEAADQFFSELTDALVRRAERDPLTDLYNRQTFHDRLTRELARARRYGRELTVVMIDLNAFKQVNDQLGHLAGDAVLKRLASLLTTHTRDEDIVGRLGGDEFAVALVETGMDTARDLIRRLRIHLAPARRQFGLPKEFGVGFGAASFPERGSTVEELLFAADAALYRNKGGGRGTQMQETGATPELRKLHVLVVDDDPGIRALCGAILESQGFSVRFAQDGANAMREARAQRPDLVLLDVMMPAMDGWQTAEALAADPALADVPIVMMTGRSGSESIERAARIGARNFIDKPFGPDELITVVNEVLDEVAERETTDA